MLHLLKLWQLFVMCLAVTAPHPGSAQIAKQSVKIVYPAPSSTTWPLWIAKEAGYYEKYGLDVSVEFALHPAEPASWHPA